MSDIVLHEGDNRETLQRLIGQGVRVHSVVTDPPYGLTSIRKRFGKKGSAPAKFGTDGAFQRAGAGFMGQAWDGNGIERDPEFWSLVWEILLPGGYCLAFSGARTGHWQAVAMEQAGFDMHPMTGWVFGSGFPKAHDAAKAIDKAAGHEGESVPTGAPVKRMIPGADQHRTGDWTKTDARHYQPGEYIPATTEATAWEGWKYGAAALKPALEPIYVGQKPFKGTGVANLLKHGVGALNIDGCRVPSESRPLVQSDRRLENNTYGAGLSGSRAIGSTELGRHPANLLHDGSDEVRALFGDSKGQQAAVRGTEPSRTGDGACYGKYSGERPPAEPRQETDTSAARFFNAFPVEPEALYYHAKASARDRVTQCNSCGQHAVGGKPDCDCEERTLRGHPTVKPIGLMRHLVRLVTPPGGTVLDPFAGTGTTGQAAREEGFDCILMEADAQYCGDIRARLDLPAGIASDTEQSAAADLVADPLIAQLLGGGIAAETEQAAALEFLGV